MITAKTAGHVRSGLLRSGDPAVDGDQRRLWLGYDTGCEAGCGRVPVWPAATRTADRVADG